MKNEIKFTRVCAWCKKILEKGDPNEISHGMCDICFKKEIHKGFSVFTSKTNLQQLDNGANFSTYTKELAKKSAHRVFNLTQSK